MKGRKSKEAPSTDLLVCFPSRAHLHHHHHHHHHLKKSSTINGVGAGQASPLIWAKSKRREISEPTSPKVTCAGQIKERRHKPKPCKSWQSVMEEIERLHNNKKHKKKPAWIEAIGFTQFLACLRNLRFDLRCFPTARDHVITSDDEEEEEETNTTVFSKWFMVLQENQNTEFTKTQENLCNNDAPPPNALLLMRCRSAPVKSWLTNEEEKKKKSLVVMTYTSDFYKLSRSRSSKR